MRGLVNVVGSGLVAVVVALSLAGCGDNGTSGASASGSAAPDASWSRPEAPPDPRTLVRASELAVSQVPDSALIFIESLTSDAGTWKAGLVTPDGTEHQVKIGSDGIAVLVGPTVTDDGEADKAKRRANVEGAHLDFRSAVDTVLAAVPNGSITELSLLDINGTVVWNADVWDQDLAERDVTVDAASGKVTANRRV